MSETISSYALSQHLNLLWAQGNWPELATFAGKCAEISEVEKAYIAVALLQQCQNPEAKVLLGLQKDVKHKKNNTVVNKQKPDGRHVVALLLAGCYSSLAKANLINGEQVKAAELITQAVSLTEPTFAQALIYQLRTDWLERQCRDAMQDTTVDTAFTVQTLSLLELGDAWAGNTVNTVIFRHHGIFTFGNQQYTAFYVDKHTLRVAQRNLGSNELLFSDIVGHYNIKDAHNSISLGMDREGYIHISYDHHGTQLKYRRSLQPYSITEFSDELEMTGQREQKVTYPAFIMSHADEPLQLLYRDGNHQKGAAYLKSFSETEKRWFDSNTAILAGDTNLPWTSNAYWNHPVKDKEGNSHLSFIWRTHHIGEQQQINNMNICYAKTYDNGKTWFSSNNKPFKLPITQVNAEVVWPVSPASNLINQTSMAVDSQNRPHIVFYANDKNGIVQYQHLWFDGKQWHQQIISNRTEAFNLCGGGTLRIPISRPEIVIDQQDNVFVIYRGDFTGDRMAALCLKAPNYNYAPTNQQILHPEPLGLAEPVIDRLRWLREQILSLLVQYNDQPNHDVGHASVLKPISIIDVLFNV